MREALAVLAAVSLGCASTRSEPPAPTVSMSTDTPTPDASVPPPRFPVTRAEPIRETIHGLTVEDPYRWLEDEKSPEVQAWMAAQDRRTRDYLARQPGRDALRERYRALSYLDQFGVPVRRGKRLFYGRQLKDKEKGVVYVREDGGDERVLLDPNTWSTDNTVSLGVWVPSWDGQLVVFARKPNAADESILYVLNVDTLQESAVDVIAGAKYASPSWTPDGKAFYYEWIPEVPREQIAERPGKCELRKHVLGTPPASDERVHPATGDAQTFLGGSLSRDGKWLLVSISHGWNATDWYFQRLGVDSSWRLLVKGKGDGISGPWGDGVG